MTARVSYLIYALGGGHGHVVRCASLAAELASLGHPTRLLVPLALAKLARSLHADIVPVARPQDRHELAAVIRGQVEGQAPRRLIVDCFPEGLYGELLDLAPNPPRIALLRCRRDAGQARFHRGLALCERVIDLEAHLRWLPTGAGAEPHPPVTRVLSRAATLQSCVVVAGEARTRAFLQGVAARLRRRGVACSVLAARDDFSRLVPGRELDARVIVGAAGFNLSYEAVALGAWHLALPASRPFDDQMRRARVLAELADGPEAFVRKLFWLLDRPEPPQPRVEIAPMSSLARLIVGGS